MKALALVTHTADCENKWKSLEAVGHDVHVLQYDLLPHERHGELLDRARELQPDFIVYLGAIEQYHKRPVPRPELLRSLREVCPTIHLCGDGADPPWWPHLEEYDRQDCFDAQVSMDGSPETPIGSFENGLVLLTPIDHRPFEAHRLGERPIRMGMVGGRGHTNRRDLVTVLEANKLLHVVDSSEDRSYDELARILCTFKATFNHAATGTGDRMHVKGRVVEAGFARCALFEQAGAPTNNWFTPGTDYFEYRNAHHLMKLLRELDDLSLTTTAANLYYRMTSEHHPKIFWDRVLTMAGVANGVDGCASGGGDAGVYSAEPGKAPVQ